MTDPATGLSVLHVIVRAGPTNCQYNEHCLPVRTTRKVTVCSLFPADVVPPPELTLYEGDGTRRGCLRAMRRALESDTYDVVHVHAPASGLVALATYARLHRSREDLVFTVHNSWRNFRARNRLFLRLIIALFPLVVVCGQAAHASLPSRLRRRHAEKLTTVPNGVDVDRIDRVLANAGRRESPRGPGLRFVSPNRLIRVKDPLTLISVFARARSSHDQLVLLGDGKLRNRVERRCAKLGLSSNVVLTGVVPRDDVYRTMASSDLFVSTSAGEGLPVALLEAMTCGLPVVVSDIAPHREVARAAGGLPLVPVGDVAGFARAVKRLAALSTEGRAQIGRRLRRCVLESYSVEVMSHRYGTLYAELASRRSASLEQTEDTARLGAWAALTLTERLRRRIGLLVVATIVGAVVGFTVASVQSPVYKGETTVRVGQDLGVAGGEEAMQASAAVAVQYADLARREPVLGLVADAGFAETWRDLQPDVFSRVGDKNPQLVRISVYQNDRAGAARLASAVADALIVAAADLLESPGSEFVQGQVAAIEQDIRTTDAELQRLRSRLEAVGPGRHANLRGRIARLQSTLAEQRGSFGELGRIDTSDTAAVSVVDEAWTTLSPLRPTPLVLALAGAAIGALLAVAWVHLFGRPPRSRKRHGRPPTGTTDLPPVLQPHSHSLAVSRPRPRAEAEVPAEPIRTKVNRR